MLVKKSTGQVCRILKHLCVHGLIKKIAHSYKYHLTRLGRKVIATALKLKELVIIPELAIFLFFAKKCKEIICKVLKRVFGERLNRNLYITKITERGKRQFRTLQSIQRFSIVARESRSGQGIYRLLLMKNSSIKKGCRHKRFGVHY